MALLDTRKAAIPTPPKIEFSAAEIGALAHLYRGEVYRSTVWRTRLDSTTNWAAVTTGIALSATFSSAEASPLPMVLVGLIVTVFLMWFEVTRHPDRSGSLGQPCGKSLLQWMAYSIKASCGCLTCRGEDGSWILPPRFIAVLYRTRPSRLGLQRCGTRIEP